jgi:rare lipoprotein A
MAVLWRSIATLTAIDFCSLPAFADEATRTQPIDGDDAVIEGDASYFGDEFAGRKTVNGEHFNPEDLTAVSKKLPLGSQATLTDQETGKSVEVRINDRCPYVEGRVRDLSKVAADRLEMVDDDTSPAWAEVDPDKQSNPEIHDRVEEMANGQKRKQQ